MLTEIKDYLLPLSRQLKKIIMNLKRILPFVFAAIIALLNLPNLLDKNWALNNIRLLALQLI